MKFVDALDKLAYVTVDQATTFNDSYSRLVMVHTGEGKSCLEKLMEDLPAIMEEYL